MHNSNEFEYTTQEMPTPLKTTRGKTRLDKYGNPLTSIRIKQSLLSKEKMIQRMEELDLAYRRMPEYFPPDRVSYGLDPTPMHTERVFNDLEDQIIKWRQSHSNDILMSFVIRHNTLLDYLKKHIMIADPTGADAGEIEQMYGIRQKKRRHKAVEAIINNNFQDLFE